MSNQISRTEALGVAGNVEMDVSTLLSSLNFRCIGPFKGGRACAVVGHPTDPMVFYFGASAGGVWRTEDGGTYWENVSDGYFFTSAVGALAIAESDPNVLYAGTGEACIRNDVSSGDGVYRSTDGGATWAHVGLADSRHIGRILVHPSDPDLVYVAALGHAWGPSDERGVFRSRDGGATWERVLFVSPHAGAVDLAMDSANPRVLYASMWEVLRQPWTISSGGEGSGLYRSTDGGDTWVEMTENPGLPGGVWGRVGVALTAAQPGRVYAMIEAEEGGLHRSDDGGATWSRVNDVDGRYRPWYFTHLTADPTDPDTVWVMDLRLRRSADGGLSFVQVAGTHGDHHELWIDPRNPHRMINANDGGASVSFNGGRSWSSIYNQPTAAFYHVAVDNRLPYVVYGTQQDNAATSVPSQTSLGCIRWADCYPVGHSESGHIAVRPDNPNIVYSGSVGSLAAEGIGDLSRCDHAAGDVAELRTVWPENVTGWAPKEHPYRFQFTYPILLSPHDPDVLYVAGNQVFRSLNEGCSWEAISPDLTRDDPAKQETSGGPITVEGDIGIETYCTIFALAESTIAPGVLWAGSDDGLLHLTTDGGDTWTDITPPTLPEWATIATIEPSPHDRATAYVAAYRYKLDDYQPYLYRTSDYGQTWQEITTGIDEHDFTRVIRCDPVQPGLLYSGTETGLYVSTNDGRGWHRVFGNPDTGTRLPVTPIYDLNVHEDDLVIATHGRSFWILDDLSVLRQHTARDFTTPVRLFTPGPARLWLKDDTWELAPGQPGWIGYHKRGAAFRDVLNIDGTTVRRYLDAGNNPIRGVAVSYWVSADVIGEGILEFLTADGTPIRRFTSDPGSAEKALPIRSGLHRFVWDMHTHGPVPLDTQTQGALTAGSLDGPEVPPGDYLVQLTLGGTTVTAPVQILPDPRVGVPTEDLVERYRLECRIREARTAVHEAINRIGALRSQAQGWAQRTANDPAVTAAATKVIMALGSVEDELIQTKIRVATDQWKHPTKLVSKLRTLALTVAHVHGAPPRQCFEVFDTLYARVSVQLRRLAQVVDTDVAAFNDLIRDSGVPALVALGDHTTQHEKELPSTH